MLPKAMVSSSRFSSASSHSSHVFIFIWGLCSQRKLIMMLGKIMAEVLTILALSTNEMQERRISTYSLTEVFSTLISKQRDTRNDWWEERASRMRCKG